MGHKMGGYANKTWHFPEDAGALYGFGRRKQIPDTWRAYTKVFTVDVKLRRRITVRGMIKNNARRCTASMVRYKN